ncbi:AAA family ATPase [Methylomonas sp. SURF-2]|uniref:AAA family ATPase n=1 Tax=Methylomonas subterranea TaxID=2952225 RepID=A0ABT1TKI4_9GAMM|nr:bifunctional aminoglycoside phosphotransferase/ATP-binding protein [Methylomonas sp. SURF-2]MCQ8105587.1 AAA family ATPase [Methylomonas sp. SURF-2]
MVNGDLDCTLIESLKNPACYPHPVDSVRLLETHISWVLLAGDFAYKIKKPVDFGFLNFTELTCRQRFCREELRLNRRLAPSIYLDVIGLGGGPQQPIFGAEPAFEYAVKMRRFAEQDLLDHVLARGALTRRHMQNLAYTLAGFHAGLPPATADSGHGTAEAVALPARQNFQQLALLLPPGQSSRLADLRAASEREYAACLPLFTQRRRDGMVRECHGDLHLGNIVLLGGQPTPFDGIEFNPALRWIDVMNDIAFLLMDLQQRQRPDLAFAFLDAYMQASGDYAGLGVLRFYLAYRSMVMAKVSAIRAAQLGGHGMPTQCRRYLALAGKFYLPAKPGLIITHGLPGCGKTTLSQLILEKLGCIRLRSDVERKRLFGLQPHQTGATEIYAAEASAKTYRHLLRLASDILHSGYSVIVDAAFLKLAERRQFQALADNLNVPFAIAAIEVDETLQRQRLSNRQNDASDADTTVLDFLKTAHETLSGEELESSVIWLNNGSEADIYSQSSAWDRLNRLLRRVETD